MTYQQVRKYEAAENRISAASLYHLAQLLNVKVCDFYDGLPGHDRRSSQSPGSAPPVEGMDNLLARIDDAEVRQHLAGLLQALAVKQ